MNKKKALITGITGQVGSYLAEYLLAKDYEVYGLNRRKSIDNFANLANVIDDIEIIEGDITDNCSVDKVIDRGKFNEVYNLAAQSHVHTSFEQPIFTFHANTLGVLYLLEAIRRHSNHTRFYQASTSELFGMSPPPQSERTRFLPQSPYAAAKLAAHELVRIYHESYHLWAACGIMFNTESPRRGDNFVTKKITNWVAKYKDLDAEVKNTHVESSFDGFLDMRKCVLELGNIDARRDWSHASDSVEAIYRICNQDLYYKGQGLHDGVWRSYAFGSGKAYTVREFLAKCLEMAFDCMFSDRFEFKGSGIEEVLVDKNYGLPCMKISEKFYRPAEVDFLQCDPTLIKEELGWEPKCDLDDIIRDMLGKTLVKHNVICTAEGKR